MSPMTRLSDRRGSERRLTKTPRVRNLIAFSSLIMLLFCVVVGVQATRSYQSALEAAKMDAARLTRILSDHAELTLLGVDLSLRRAVEKQYFNQLFGGNLPNYVEHNFRMWVNETPQIVAMLMVDEKGVIQVAAHKKVYERWLDYSTSLEASEIFARMKESTDENVVIMPLESASLPQSRLVAMGRPLNKLDGSFGGVVIAAIDTRYFSDFFDSVERSSKRYMSLMLADRTVLVSGPRADAVDGALVDSAVQQIQGKPDPHEISTEMRSVSGTLKIVSYRMLKNFPVVMSVVLDETDFLYEWRQGRVKDIGFLAIFTVFGSVLSFFALTMAKQIILIEESEAAAILASQAKSEFLANMSHELRTPLNAIIGFSEMMGSGYFGPMTPKQKERIHDITLCGNHLLQLISDILEFSKGDAGKLELVEEKVDVAETLTECARIIQEKVKGKHINLVTDVEPSLPPIWADKRKIRQIVLNLLSNAIKFTPEQGMVKLLARLDQAGNMNIIVSDTGIGIAEEDIPTALSVFGQVHRSQSHEGTGLGLPLCKMFAELHGGKLTLTSAVGEGTTVRITLPGDRVMMADA